MEKDPRQLYQSVIMRHNRAPVRYEKRPEAEVVIEAYNPLCGDHFKLFLDVEGGRVIHAYFHGYGCAISKASTSVLVDRIEGCTLDEIRSLIDHYLRLIKGDADLAADPDEELQAFTAARDFPARLQCATLAWEYLQRYLKG